MKTRRPLFAVALSLLVGIIGGLVGMVVVRDPDVDAPPSVRLSIDFSNVTGVGLKTGTKYVTSGEQELVRPLVATDVVDVTFAFFPRGATGFTRDRQALASFTLNYNLRAETFVSGKAGSSVNVTDRLLAQ